VIVNSIILQVKCLDGWHKKLMCYCRIRIEEVAELLTGNNLFTY